MLRVYCKWRISPVSDPQDAYFRTMNVLLSPFRFLISCIQAMLVIILVALTGVAWPLILYVRREAVTPAAFIISGLTLLTIFTLFYTSGYFVYGAIALGIGGLGYVMVTHEVPDSFISNFQTYVLIFLLVGILQKFLRNH